MAKAIFLEKNERIIAVVPEHAHGPGWDNKVVWVHIVDSVAGTYRVESIQADEMTDEMKVLFDIGRTVMEKMTNSIPVVKNKK